MLFDYILKKLRKIVNCYGIKKKVTVVSPKATMSMRQFSVTQKRKIINRPLNVLVMGSPRKETMKKWVCLFLLLALSYAEDASPKQELSDVQRFLRLNEEIEASLQRLKDRLVSINTSIMDAFREVTEAHDEMMGIYENLRDKMLSPAAVRFKQELDRFFIKIESTIKERVQEIEAGGVQERNGIDKPQYGAGIALC